MMASGCMGDSGGGQLAYGHAQPGWAAASAQATVGRPFFLDYAAVNQCSSFEAAISFGLLHYDTGRLKLLGRDF